MPFGSIFGRVKNAVLETADNKRIKLENRLVPRAVLAVLGIPHIGLRVRANRIFKLLESKKNVKILDAGCGAGAYSLTLAKMGKEVHGFDINQEKVRQAIRINKQLGLNANFSVANIYHLKNYPKNYFDVVLCSDVLEHLKYDGKALKEIYGVLKYSGELIITVPANTKINRKYKKTFGHEQLYTEKLLSGILKKNNFSIKITSPYLCFFGRSAWNINRSLFRSKILTAITFYPLYMLTFFDYWFHLRNGEGMAVKAVKIKQRL